MATWYYYNESGDKIEVTGGQLKGLAKAGMITPETIVETDDGKKARAGKVKGLTFITPSTNEESYGLASPSEPSSPTAPLSETEDVPVDAIPEGEETVIAPPVAAQTVSMLQVIPPPPAANVFCTNCGNPVAEQAVACMSCGARPTGHKKFCRHCGVALNPEQIVCIKCGAGIEQAAFVQPAQAIMPSVTSLPLADHPTFGKVLASGNGKGNPEIVATMVSMIFLAGVIMALLFFMSYTVNQLSDTHAKGASVAKDYDAAEVEAIKADRYRGYSWVIFIAAFIVPVIAILYTVLYCSCLAKSEITIYENGLAGITGFPSSVFQTTYDKITSVNVLKYTLTIHVSGKSYKCYTANQLVADEIHRVIVNRRTELKLPGLSDAPPSTPMLSIIRKHAIEVIGVIKSKLKK